MPLPNHGDTNWDAALNSYILGVESKADNAQATVDALAGAAILLTGNNNPTITDNRLPNGFARIDLAYTGDGETPDALTFRYQGTRTGYHNEYGELRARPALPSTVALRAQAHISGTSNGDIAQVTSADNVDVYLGVSQSAVHTSVPITMQGDRVAVDHGYSPSDYGLKAWVGDPGYLAGSLAVATGTIHLMKVKVPKAVTINNIVHRQTGGAVSLTNGFAGLYDVTGNLLGVSADQAANWIAPGVKTTPLVGPVAVPAGYVYVGLLFAGTTGPNLPRFGTASAFNNANLPANALRFAQFGAGLTEMPATIDMNTITDNQTACLWVGIS